MQAKIVSKYVEFDEKMSSIDTKKEAAKLVAS